MSVGDYGRRLDKLTEALGASRRDPFRPERVLLLLYTEHWRFDGSVEALAERDEIAQNETTRQATVDQVVEWVAEDARRHRYDLPYMLVLQFMADDPVHCVFDLPWHTGRDGFRGWSMSTAFSWPLDQPRSSNWW